jgi:hypothetical protein
MRRILATGRQRREDALFAVGFTEKSADGRRSQNVSLLTEAKHFLPEAGTSKRFRFCGKRNQNVMGVNGCSEGQLSAQDRSFVAGFPSDRSIRLADVGENQAFGRNRPEASTLIKTDPVMLKIIDPPDAQIYENGKVREGQERLLVGWIVRREVRWFKST